MKSWQKTSLMIAVVFLMNVSATYVPAQNTQSLGQRVTKVRCSLCLCGDDFLRFT
jgi:hypothetical protein